MYTHMYIIFMCTYEHIYLSIYETYWLAWTPKSSILSNGIDWYSEATWQWEKKTVGGQGKCVRTWVRWRGERSAYTYIYMHVCVLMCLCVCAYKHIHTHTCTCVYIHTHTHVRESYRIRGLVVGGICAKSTDFDFSRCHCSHGIHYDCQIGVLVLCLEGGVGGEQ